MNDIELKALALVNEVAGIGCYALCDAHPINLIEALCRAIEQHEAFRQEVSDVVYRSLMSIAKGCAADAAGDLSRFIIPKPDPLVEVVQNVGLWAYNPERNWAGEIRAALEARGLEIREKGQ